MLSGEGEVCLSVQEFSRLPPAIQTLIIDKAVQSVLGRLPHLNFEHYLEIISLCAENAHGKAIRLPHGLEARREGYVLKIAHPTAPTPPIRFRTRKIRIPGKTVIKRLNIQIDSEVLVDDLPDVGIDLRQRAGQDDEDRHGEQGPSSASPRRACPRSRAPRA